MDRKNRMIKTTILYFIGNFASKMLAFFLIPLYTTYLTIEDYGSIDLLISLLPLVGPIFSMSMVESVFRFLAEERKVSDGKTAITNSTFIYVCSAVMFVIIYGVLSICFDMKLGVLFIVYVFVIYTNLYLQQILRGLQENKKYATVGVMATFIQAALNIYFIVILGYKGESLLLSGIITSAIISIYIIIVTKLWSFINVKLISMAYIKKELAYGIPLIPNQICWWAIQLVGKYFLVFYGLSELNGIYAIAEKFPALFTTISGIFFLAWTENLIYEYHTSDRDTYCSQLYNKLILNYVCLASLLLPLIKIYNTFAVRGEFNEGWKLIPILMLGVLFNSFATFFGSFYTVSMETKKAFYTSLSAGVINIILSYFLIGKMGLLGVAISNMSTYVIFAIIRWFSIKSLVQLKLKIERWYVLLFIFSFTMYYMDHLLLQFCSILISILIIGINQKTIILQYKNKLGFK